MLGSYAIFMLGPYKYHSDLTYVGRFCGFVLFLWSFLAIPSSVDRNQLLFVRVFRLLLSNWVKSERENPDEDRHEYRSWQDVVSDINHKLDAMTQPKGESANSVNVSIADNEKLCESLRFAVTKQLEETTLDELRSHFSLDDIIQNADSARRRLNNAIKVTGGRVTRNLAWGILFALVAIVVLTVFLFQTPEKNDLTTATIFFIPRLAFVGIIQTISYFFLRLYRGGIEDLKYYQNEVTNIELRICGVHTALAHGTDEAKTAAIQSLLKTERNQIIGKDKTSVQLESARLQGELDAFQNVFEQFSSAINATKEPSTKSQSAKKKSKS